MKNCIECGGDLKHVQIKYGIRKLDRLKCEYCDFYISCNEGDLKALKDYTSPPPTVIKKNNEY